MLTSTYQLKSRTQQKNTRFGEQGARKTVHGLLRKALVDPSAYEILEGKLDGVYKKVECAQLYLNCKPLVDRSTFA